MSKILSGFKLHFRFLDQEISIGTIVCTTKIEDEDEETDESTEVHQVNGMRSVPTTPPMPSRPVGFSPQID
jgi:hypothetical protein